MLVQLKILFLQGLCLFYFILFIKYSLTSFTLMVFQRVSSMFHLDSNNIYFFKFCNNPLRSFRNVHSCRGGMVCCGVARGKSLLTCGARSQRYSPGVNNTPEGNHHSPHKLLTLPPTSCTQLHLPSLYRLYYFR